MTDTPMTRARRCACALLAGLFALSAPAGAQVRLPAMGEAASAGMPLGEERRLGDRVAIEVHRDPSYLDDPILTEYMRGLWRPLLRAAQQRGEIGADMQQQFAWELYGVLLILHMSQRLLDDPRADARAETAFAAMLERARK